MPRWPAARPVASSRRRWLGRCSPPLFLVIATLAGPGPSLSDWLGDTDDAVRLVTVRELLGGAPWFDTTLPRIGAPEPLVSHWSRLIDAAARRADRRSVAAAWARSGAELATRIVWPALLFFVLALMSRARRSGAPVRWPRPSRWCWWRPRPWRWRSSGPAASTTTTRRSCAPSRASSSSRAAWTMRAPAGSPAPCSAWGSPSATRRSRWSCRRWDWPRWWRVWRPATRVGAGVTRAAAVGRGRAARGAGRDRPAGALARRALRRAVAQPRRCSRPAGAAGLWARTRPRQARPAIRLAILGAARRGRRRRSTPASSRPAWPGRSARSSPALKPIWLDHVMETKSMLWLAASHPGAGAGGRGLRACRARRRRSRSGAGGQTRARDWPRHSSCWRPCSGAGRSS